MGDNVKSVLYKWIGRRSADWIRDSERTPSAPASMINSSFEVQILCQRQCICLLMLQHSSLHLQPLLSMSFHSLFFISRMNLRPFLSLLFNSFVIHLFLSRNQSNWIPHFRISCITLIFHSSQICFHLQSFVSLVPSSFCPHLSILCNG